MSCHSDHDQEDTPPADDIDPCRLKIDATEDVPRELRLCMSAEDIRPYQHVILSVRELEEGPARSTDGHRPGWVGGIGKPRSMLRQQEHLQRVFHRGEEVEPLTVFAPDNRAAYHDTRYPWGCVCRVLPARGGFGSGVLIGPRHVLTASHCIDWSSDGAGSVEVHRSQGTWSAMSAITRVYYTTKVGDPVTYSENDEDFAVIVTADRLGDRFGWMGCRTYSSRWDMKRWWYNIGYPGDLPVRSTDTGRVPHWQRHHYLDEDELDYGSARSMRTDADMYKGQSGGPMFAWWNEGGSFIPYAVAVVSSQTSRHNLCSGGSALTRLVNRARRENP
jgi:V8-like Glu-specific endopeptidase